MFKNFFANFAKKYKYKYKIIYKNKIIPLQSILIPTNIIDISKFKLIIFNNISNFSEIYYELPLFSNIYYPIFKSIKIKKKYGYV